MKWYCKNRGTLSQKNQYPCDSHKNISHISWNKHYTDHDRNYAARTVGSAAAVLHLQFCLFYCRWLKTHCIILVTNFFFFSSVERNLFFPPNYSFSSCPLHHNYLGEKKKKRTPPTPNNKRTKPSKNPKTNKTKLQQHKKNPNHQSRFSFYTVAALARPEKSVILWVSLSNGFLTYSLRLFI